MDTQYTNTCRDCKYRKGSLQWSILMECKAILTALGAYASCSTVRRHHPKACPYWKKRFSLVDWFKSLFSELEDKDGSK